MIFRSRVWNEKSPEYLQNPALGKNSAISTKLLHVAEPPESRQLVPSMLTGNKDIGRKNSDFVKSISRIIGENELIDEAVSIAAETKISGFDSVFIACAKVNHSLLITDDKKMHEVAIKVGVKSKLLREMGT